MGDGHLTVANKANDRSQFNVRVQGNVTIRNFKDHKDPTNANEVKTVVKNGEVHNYYKWENMNHATSERALNLSSNNYNIFAAISKADKSDKKGEILSKSDLEALRKNPQLQKELGIKVKYDPDEQVYGIYGANGSTLYFDFD